MSSPALPDRRGAGGAFDVIVLGLGALGSAALHQLAARGARVLGLDERDPPHAEGSSHGASRALRCAFAEPAYVPLARRALELWRDLEAEAGEPLYRRTGALLIGPADHPALAITRGSAARHGLAHEALDAAEIRRRFPALAPAEGEAGVFEEEGGLLPPERCVIAMLEGAKRRGAAVARGERARSVTRGPGGIRVRTDRGEYAADRLVVTLGPWLPGAARALFAGDEVMASLAARLTVERQVQLWLEPAAPALLRAGPPPPLSWVSGASPHSWYIMPPFGRAGVKVGRHHGGALVTPDTVNRAASPADEEDARAFLRERAPALGGRLLAAEVGLYTNTPDRNFVLGLHPGDDRVIIAGGGSGHAFKFATAIGEVIMDLVLQGASSRSASIFSVARLSGGA